VVAACVSHGSSSPMNTTQIDDGNVGMGWAPTCNGQRWLYLSGFVDSATLPLCASAAAWSASTFVIRRTSKRVWNASPATATCAAGQLWNSTHTIAYADAVMLAQQKFLVLTSAVKSANTTLNDSAQNSSSTKLLPRQAHPVGDFDNFTFALKNALKNRNAEPYGSDVCFPYDKVSGSILDAVPTAHSCLYSALQFTGSNFTIDCLRSSSTSIIFLLSVPVSNLKSALWVFLVTPYGLTLFLPTALPPLIHQSLITLCCTSISYGQHTTLFSVWNVSAACYNRRESSSSTKSLIVHRPAATCTGIHAVMAASYRASDRFIRNFPPNSMPWLPPLSPLGTASYQLLVSSSSVRMRDCPSPSNHAIGRTFLPVLCDDLYSASARLCRSNYCLPVFLENSYRSFVHSRNSCCLQGSKLVCRIVLSRILSYRIYQKLKTSGTKSSHFKQALDGEEDMRCCNGHPFQCDAELTIFELCTGFLPSIRYCFGSKFDGHFSFDADCLFCKKIYHQIFNDFAMGLAFQMGLVCKVTERDALDFWSCLRFLLIILTVVLPAVQIGLRVRDSYPMISKQPHKNRRKLNKTFSGLYYAAFLIAFPAAVYAQSDSEASSNVFDNGYIRANPDISQYSFSSCWGGDAPGYGHCRPQIESPQVSCCRARQFSFECQCLWRSHQSRAGHRRLPTVVGVRLTFRSPHAWAVFYYGAVAAVECSPSIIRFEVKGYGFSCEHISLL